MWNLFVAECLRYRNLILIAAIAHLLLLVMLNSQSNLAQMPFVHLLPMALTIVAIVAGALQFANHKRHNHWVQLLHRPLPPVRIFVAIALAGFSMLVVALVLPFALIQILMDFQGTRGIESRHYLFIVVLMLQVLAAYMGGAFSVLYPHRLAFLALFLIWDFLPVGVDIRLPLIAVVASAGFGWLLHAAWRPDLTRPFLAPVRLVTSELMIQAGLFATLGIVLMLAFELGWSISGHNPRVVPAAGTVNTLLGTDTRGIMLASLEGATHPDSDLLRQQIAIGEGFTAKEANVKSYPRRHQRAELDNSPDLNDADQKITWHFSHGHMLFEGRHTVTNEPAGWLGTTGFHAAGAPSSDSFATVPWVTNNRFILDDNAIYQVDWPHRQLQQRFALTASDGERLNDSLAIKGNVVSLLSNRNLYLFRASELLDDKSGKPLTVSARLPLPPVYRSQLSRYQQHLDVMELVDGYLISVFDNYPVMGTEADFYKFEDSALTLYRTHGDGNNELINRRSLPTSYGTSYVYAGFVLAPGMRLFINAWDGVFESKSIELALPLFHHHFPPVILLLALLSCLGSGFTTFLLLRHVNWPASTRTTWIALNTVTGLVGVMSLFFGLLYRREPVSLPMLQSAPEIRQ